MRLKSFWTTDRRAIRAGVAIYVFSCLAVCGIGVTVAAVAGRTEQKISDDEAARDLPPMPYIKTPVDEFDALHDAYEFVGLHPEIAKYLPCFCACGRDKTHSSIEDCYIKSRGTTPKEVVWSAHAGECMICVAVATEARKMSRAGKSINEIRDEIERTLAPKFKFHTDTPLPPKDGR